MPSKIESQLRLFLSADLVGSTKLKNRLNHQELLTRYQSSRHVLDKLKKRQAELLSDEKSETAAILESLGVGTDDFDWATVVWSFYDGIHSEFVAALQVEKDKGNVSYSISNEDFKPWKAIGDELIYSIKVRGRKELHYTNIAFLRAVREMDRKVAGQAGSSVHGLRIKSSGWVAGFPVRNREIELPPDGRQDYLGPDIDTGFRIGKCTRPGMFVVSVELAELLGECRGDVAPMLGQIVGWELLKGVWNDQRYPVVWVDFPPPHPEADEHKATHFTVWEQEECSWCKAWSREATKPQLSELAKELRALRDGLPKSLGLVDPYILDDELEEAKLNSEHGRILELLSVIEAHRNETNRQDAGGNQGNEADKSQQSYDEVIRGVVEELRLVSDEHQ